MERYFRTQDNEFIDTQKHQVKPLAPNEYEWYRIDDKRAVRVFVKNDENNTKRLQKGYKIVTKGYN